MVAESKYWQFVSLTASGKPKIQEIIWAKDFFKGQFQQLDENGTLKDSLIQRSLFESTRFQSESFNQKPGFLAEVCLRCYISHQIKIVCIQLEQQFGRKYNFNRYELFPLVLDDTIDNLKIKTRIISSNYKPLAEKILETLDVKKASLSTWTTKLVKHHQELNTFLLQKGIYLVSDWAILNDTNAKQLNRILSEFHSLSEAEIKQAEVFLTAYHAVYRQERLQERRAGIKRKCQPPSEEQLTKIAALVQQKKQRLSSKATLFQLQQLATLLREYRIYIRGGGAIAQQSLDAPETNTERLQLSTSEQSSDQSEQTEFLQTYRQQFLDCLNRAIEAVVENQYERLAKKKQSTKGQYFLTGLDLFHCQGKSMAEIAPALNLTAQYQVTRLLKLKELRADIRQKLLQLLRDRLLTLATQYQTRTQLQQLEAQLEAALAERIDAVMQEAETEASIAKNRACSSLFARQLCRYLQSH